MATTRRRRIAAAGVAAAGALVLAGSTSAETAPPPTPAAPHGQLLQAPDGTLYLLVAGQAHPITPAPLTDESLAAMTAGESLPDGAFWLVPTAAWGGAPPAAAPSAVPFFATQTAVAARAANSQRVASTVATATAQAVRQRPGAQATLRARPSATVRPFGQS